MNSAELRKRGEEWAAWDKPVLGRRLKEAADYIERLEGDVSDLQHDIERHLIICTTQQNEIQRLRAERDGLAGALISISLSKKCDETAKKIAMDALNWRDAL